MDARTLRQAMAETYVDDATLAAYLPHFNAAMIAADCTNVRRAAQWCAQLGHESAGLRYMAEIQTSGPGWSWDRTRYRGRGPIQLTWSSNYRSFGQWCKTKGFVDDSELFVNNPELVEQPRWGFLAASWYWTAARPGINAMCDAGNTDGVTYAINGGYNGISDRRARYQRCLALGEALLPTGGFLMALNDGQQGEVWTGAAQFSGASRTVRWAPDWLRKWLPRSFNDPNGVWVRDEIDALVNEMVTGVFDFTTPIDFGDGKGPIPLHLVPADQPVNFTTMLRIIGARQAKSQGLIK